ncbi:hypothetical protein Lfu02_13240 [Longispora fulva]|uniref:Uncharacterized protein n=1 Tax=Longispora fulva TaxID=619741 RepID=A0A8J7GC27_9ACTN|nr:hypothetical protein [Longispora fulva]MBG6134816.1 hypothetical protein [Longispora fulva]GIG56952.1 hypothetical protein Lfu02_13240 [Longispora fulva]
MSAAGTAHWYLEQEARALVTRLDRVRPFAVHETMVPAAALAPTAQSAIDQFLIRGRRELRALIGGYLRWLAGPGRAAAPEEQQRRFTLLRLRFNDVLSQFDLFTEVITQRSEHATGVWLSGLDVLATDALRLPDAPPIACYLARGPGAAIRRVRTQLPGGAANPVAIIRVPRERMVGHGIASSLVHEVGHQAAALLSLVEVVRPTLAARSGPEWASWSRWISEILADLWSVSRLGTGSTLGLMAVVSLPRWAVFRPGGADPHPVPWLRVLVSCAFGRALYPHRQWDALSALWRGLYPPRGLAPGYAELLGRLEASIPAFVDHVLAVRPPALGGATLGDHLVLPSRRPERLLAFWHAFRDRPAGLGAQPPTLVFAAVGQARAAGLITPEAESRLLGRLLTHWALRSSLDTAAACSTHTIEENKP